MYVQMTVHDKSMGMKDYHLYNKNGLAFYVFRKSQGVLELAFGELADDIKEACIDALIMRFDSDVQELLKKNKVTWPNIESPKESKIRQFYAVQSYPTIYLINPNGEIVKNYLNTAELEDVLKNYLKN